MIRPSLGEYIAYQVANVLLGYAAIRVVMNLMWKGPLPRNWREFREGMKRQ